MGGQMSSFTCMDISEENENGPANHFLSLIPNSSSHSLSTLPKPNYSELKNPSSSSFASSYSYKERKVNGLFCSNYIGDSTTHVSTIPMQVSYSSSPPTVSVAAVTSPPVSGTSISNVNPTTPIVPTPSLPCTASSSSSSRQSHLQNKEPVSILSSSSPSPWPWRGPKKQKAKNKVVNYHHHQTTVYHDLTMTLPTVNSSSPTNKNQNRRTMTWIPPLFHMCLWKKKRQSNLLSTFPSSSSSAYPHTPHKLDSNRQEEEEQLIHTIFPIGSDHHVLQFQILLRSSTFPISKEETRTLSGPGTYTMTTSTLSNTTTREIRSRNTIPITCTTTPMSPLSISDSHPKRWDSQRIEVNPTPTNTLDMNAYGGGMMMKPRNRQGMIPINQAVFHPENIDFSPLYDDSPEDSIHLSKNMTASRKNALSSSFHLLAWSRNQNLAGHTHVNLWILIETPKGAYKLWENLGGKDNGIGGNDMDLFSGHQIYPIRCLYTHHTTPWTKKITTTMNPKKNQQQQPPNYVNEEDEKSASIYTTESIEKNPTKHGLHQMNYSQQNSPQYNPSTQHYEHCSISTSTILDCSQKLILEYTSSADGYDTYDLTSLAIHAKSDYEQWYTENYTTYQFNHESTSAPSPSSSNVTLPSSLLPSTIGNKHHEGKVYRTILSAVIPTGIGSAIYSNSSVLRCSVPPAKEIICLSKEYQVYICDLGLKNEECDLIIATAERCANGSYAAYTYAKQTLGCRDFDDLGVVCEWPVLKTCATIYKYLEEPDQNNNKNALMDSNNDLDGMIHGDSQNGAVEIEDDDSDPFLACARMESARPSSQSMGTRPKRILVLDEREPHIVKYDVSKKERQKLDMHTDKSEWTFIIALSEGRGKDYDCGGTYIEAIDSTIHLQRGQVLIFPGKLRHRGQKITRGVRFLLVGFMVDKANDPPNQLKRPL